MTIDKHLRRCEDNCMGVITGAAGDLEDFITGLFEARTLGLEAKHLTDCAQVEVVQSTQYRALFGKRCTDKEYDVLVKQAKEMGWT